MLEKLPPDMDTKDYPMELLMSNSKAPQVKVSAHSLHGGISFRLEGEANDYVGKGLSGGRIAVLPPMGSCFDASKIQLPATP